MIKERLLEARELIQAERYDEARALLKSINHPKAQEWLARLDTIAPETNTDAAYQEELRVHDAFLRARDLIQAQQYDAARQILVTLDHATAREWLAKLDTLAAQMPPENVSETESPEIEISPHWKIKPQPRRFPVMASLLVVLVIGGAVLMIVLRGNSPNNETIDSINSENAASVDAAQTVHGADDFKALAAYFPDNTVLYYGIRIDDDFIARIDALYTTIFAHLDLDSIPMSPKPHVLLELAMTTMTGSNFTTGIRPWLGDTMAVGVFNIKDAIRSGMSDTPFSSDDLSSPPGVAAVIPIKDRAAAENFLTVFSARSNGLTSSLWNGYTLFEPTDTRGNAAVIMVNDSVMIITLRMSQQYFVTPPAGPLSNDAGFNETLNLLPADGYDMVMYLNIIDTIRGLLPVYEQLTNQVAKSLLTRSDTPELSRIEVPEVHFVEVFDKLLAVDVRLASGMAVTGDSLLFDMAGNSIDITSMTASGYIMPYSAPVDPSFLAHIPANTSVMLHGTDLKGQAATNEHNTRVMVDWLNQLNITGINADEPFVNMPANVNSTEQFDTLINEQFPQFSLNTQTDIIEHASGDYAFFLTYAPLADANADIGAQNIVNGGIIIQETDDHAFKNLVDRTIAQAMGHQFGRIETIAGVNTLVFPVTLSDGSTLLMAIGASDQVFYLGTRSSAEQVFTGIGGLTSQPDFAAASAYFVPESTGYAFTSRGGLALVVDMFLMMGHRIDKVMRNVATGLDNAAPPPNLPGPEVYVKSQHDAQKIIALFESLSTSTRSTADGDMVSRLRIQFTH